MSGIAGIFYFDDRMVEHNDLKRIDEEIAFLGNDREGVYQNKNLGLIHRLFRTSPPDAFEMQPLEDSGLNLIITGDIRLDNREELLTKLSVSKADSLAMPDSRLTLFAFAKWGVECTSHLLGDFAFAIYDINKEELFCVRDHMGVKPFFYFHKPGKLFLFASTINAVLTHPDVQAELDPERIAFHLLHFTSTDTVKDKTFFKNIFRLKPAHSLLAGKNKFSFNSFWDLKNEASKIQLKTTEEYASALLARFREAVRVRIRSNAPVAYSLSGGLDSSSVVCIARKLSDELGISAPLLTVYSDCDIPECDEKEFLNAVLAEGSYEHRNIPVSHALKAAFAFSRELNEPLIMPTASMNNATMVSSSERGARVILGGHDGDTVVSHGFNYPTELMNERRWVEFRNLLLLPFATRPKINQLDLSDYLYKKSAPYLKEYGRTHSLPEFLYQVLLAVKAGVIPYSKIHKLIGRGLFIWDKRKTWADYHPALRMSFLSSNKLEEILQAEIESQYSKLHGESNSHPHAVQSNIMQIANEQIHTLSNKFGMESRHPFLDKRVIELCVAVPSFMKYDNRRGRGVLREAMKNILPEKVRNRTRKVDFSAFLIKSLQSDDKGLFEDLLFSPENNLQTFIDLKKLKNMYDQAISLGHENKARIRIFMTLNKTAYLSIWMKEKNRFFK